MGATKENSGKKFDHIKKSKQKEAEELYKTVFAQKHYLPNFQEPPDNKNCVTRLSNNSNPIVILD